MQIGEIIRKYRKEKNITQEEMARRLGVTAPAVNKWENGNSMPDIMLLAPIARMLGITVDTLLSFREELTEEEISSFVQEADTRLKKESYEEVFQWVKKTLELYPNCGQLIWQMAVVLDGWRLAKKVPDSEKYDAYINDCYLRVLDSQDEDLSIKAADSLFGFYSRTEQYEKAEEYLVYFSKQNPERKRKQAFIYSKTNRMDEAWRTYEELLFSGYQIISMVLSDMYLLAMQEKDRENAHMLVEKQMCLAKLFEMGEYQEAAAGLDLAVAEQNVEKTLQIMERMLSGLDTISSFSKSSLYRHMTFKSPREEFLAGIRRNLLENFRDEETFGFLRGEKRWNELVEGKHERMVTERSQNNNFAQ